MAVIKPDPPKVGTARVAGGSPAALAAPAPGRYEIDTGHSAVTFRTRYLFGLAQIAMTPGSFTARGTACIDRAGFGVTAHRGLADRYLDMTVEVRCACR